MSLKQILERELAEAQARHEALSHYPDLEVKRDRWGRHKLYSHSLTKKAVKFEVQNQCDCCDKALVYALPYEEFKCVRIYAPCELPIAKRFTNGKIFELDCWEDDFYDVKCSKHLIAAVTKWLEPCEIYEDYYDDGDDDEDG